MLTSLRMPQACQPCGKSWKQLALVLVSLPVVPMDKMAQGCSSLTGMPR